jgi:hypothetical protein
MPRRVPLEIAPELLAAPAPNMRRAIDNKNTGTPPRKPA